MHYNICYEEYVRIRSCIFFLDWCRVDGKVCSRTLKMTVYKPIYYNIITALWLSMGYKDFFQRKITLKIDGKQIPCFSSRRTMVY